MELPQYRVANRPVALLNARSIHGHTPLLATPVNELSPHYGSELANDKGGVRPRDLKFEYRRTFTTDHSLAFGGQSGADFLDRNPVSK